MELTKSTAEVTNAIKALQDKEEAIFDAAYLKSKPVLVRENFLFVPFEEFCEKLKTAIQLLPHHATVATELENWILKLTYKIAAHENTKSDTQKLLNKYRKNFKVILNDIKNSLPVATTDEEQIKSETSATTKSSTPRMAKRSGYNTTELNQQETALLMLYLRDSKTFLANTSNVMLADCFSKLTGFSEKQLVQDMSGKAQSDKSEITDKAVHYEHLILHIEAIVAQIKKDKSKLK